jgi:hypothetical protein
MRHGRIFFTHRELIVEWEETRPVTVRAGAPAGEQEV